MNVDAVTERRFWSKVDKSGDCWEWTAGAFKDGYGSFSVVEGGKRRCPKVHRVAYELQNGPIPPGLMVRHTCDNKRCVRGTHLILGTNADNLGDVGYRGRRLKKITREQREALVTEYLSTDATQRALADKYGVSQRQVWNYLHAGFRG